MEGLPDPLRASRVAALCVTPATTLAEVLACHHGAADLGLPVGIALVVDEVGRLLGTVTDGDVRRSLVDEPSLARPAGELMSADPITFPAGTAYGDILRLLPGELERRGRRSTRFLGKVVLVDAERRPVSVLEYHQLWEQRVATHRHVAVIGMGYVGLTLALVMAEEGFSVTGVDVAADRVAGLAAGRAHVHEVGLPELLREQLDHGFGVSTEIPDDADVFVIAVGTPVEDTPEGHVPDLRTLRAASEAVASRMRPGALVILRSTVPVGTCREVVQPILERISGLEAGTDFHLSFAPERTAEGRALIELRVLPQLVGGINADSVEATVALFRELTPTIVRMETIEAAELAKLVNNAFRDLSFAFANHVAQLAAPFNFDVVAALEAANRAYPRNPVPLPSPGVGGPCLTKDPYILASVAGRAGLGQTLPEAGRAVNESMPAFVVTSLLKQIEAVGKDPMESTVLLAGLAFKGEPETGDFRQSTALDIARLLQGRVGRLLGHDEVVDPAEIAEAGIEPVSLDDGLAAADAVAFLNNHRVYAKLDVFDAVRRLRSPAVVFDGWHLFRPEDVLRAAPSVYLGIGFVRSSVPGVLD